MTGRRVVAITGASSGVGRASARRFAARGDSVALIARSGDALKEAAREVEDAGARALILPLDVSDAQRVEDAAFEIERDLGPLDVWVNAAMVSVYAPAWDLQAGEVARVAAVNYLGTINGTLSALRRMRARDRGTIVQVGSGLAHRAIPLQAAYCASKHAIRGFTESLRTELLHDRSHVRVTIVQLPGLNTPHFTRVRSRLPRAPRPVAPVYTPDLAARAIVYAAGHPQRREYVVGAVTSLMISAQKLVPAALDRYLARTGFDSQMTDDTIAWRDGNLFDVIEGDPGADGPFLDEAHDRSVQGFLSRHRLALGLTASVAAGALGIRRRG
jgi:short-subunit dehydrogenase